MNSRRSKRSRNAQRQDAPISFTEDSPKNVPDPTGTTPPPDQDPDK